MAKEGKKEETQDGRHVKKRGGDLDSVCGVFKGGISLEYMCHRKEAYRRITNVVILIFVGGALVMCEMGWPAIKSVYGSEAGLFG
jgi:hypothetical protein